MEPFRELFIAVALTAAFQLGFYEAAGISEPLTWYEQDQLFR